MKANDQILFPLIPTVILVGLLLLIFPGLRNMGSYVIWGIMILVMLAQIFGAMTEGYE